MEAIGTQCVGDGIEQPRAVSLTLRGGIDDKLGDQRVAAGLGVRVVAGPDGCEAGEALRPDGHQHPVLGQRRTEDCLLPTVGHVGQIDCGEHAVRGLLGQMCHPRPALQRGNGLCLGGKGQAYGICDHGRHGTHHSRCSEPKVALGRLLPR